MAATPFEHDQPTPSRIQRVMMAAMRRPQALGDRGRGGKDPKSPGARAIPLDRVSLTIDAGVLMALGPEGDPIPPADFIAAAAGQSDAKVAWSGGETVSASKVAVVLKAQSRGPLGPGQGDQSCSEAWIKTMLGLGPQPAMASEAELRGERGVCELTAFGRELMITMPSGRSFLVADAAPAHRAEATVGLTLADGQAVSIGDLVARLRAHVEQGQAPGAGSASAEVALPGCTVQGAADGLLLQLPSVGVARLANLGDAAAAGPRVSIFRTNGETAGMADMVAELGPAPIPSSPATAGREGAAVSPRSSASEAPAGGTANRDPAERPSMAAPVPLTVTLPDGGGSDAERVAVVVIDGVPQGAVLSAGVSNGDGGWMVSPQDLSELALTVPAACKDDVILKVTAFVIENREGEMTAVSDSIRLSLDRDAPIALAIDPAVLQAGGPGLNALVIRDLPEGARLSAGTYDPGIGGWVLLPRQLDGLTLTPPAGQPGFTLTVLGVSLGAGGSGQAKVLTRLAVASR